MLNEGSTQRQQWGRTNELVKWFHKEKWHDLLVDNGTLLIYLINRKANIDSFIEFMHCLNAKILCMVEYL